MISNRTKLYAIVSLAWKDAVASRHRGVARASRLKGGELGNRLGAGCPGPAGRAIFDEYCMAWRRDRCSQAQCHGS